MASALDRIGVATGGEPLIDVDREAFGARWREVRQQALPDEPLILHFAGHGIKAASGGLYLAASGGEARPDLVDDTCISVEGLLSTAENSGRPVLFLFDVCGAGQAVVQQQLRELASDRPQSDRRSTWIIGACTADASAYGARFTTAAASVLHQLADGDLDVSPELDHVPIETFAAAIDRRMARSDQEAGRPRQGVVRTSDIHADSGPQPFFRNPAYSNDGGRWLLSTMNPLLREFALGCAPGLDPLHFATRAAGDSTANTILFSGRRSQLERIEGWTHRNGDGGHRLLAVTGGPGSGKSALLGVTVCLLHPELAPLGDRVGNAVRDFDPRQPEIFLAVHARHLSLGQIVESLWHQFLQQTSGRVRPAAEAENADGTVEEAEQVEEVDPGDVDALLRRLGREKDVLVVLDALDEAALPTEVLHKILLPLATSDETAGCRVIVGTRTWWESMRTLQLHLLKQPEAELNLDPLSDGDRLVLAEDLSTYLRGLLPRRDYRQDTVRQIAESLAQYNDHGAFLVAALYADHLLHSGGTAAPTPPSSITEVFDLHLQSLRKDDPWVGLVLSVIGEARGEGMPLELIHGVALAHHTAGPHQPTPQLADTRRAVAKASFYLRTVSDTDHRLLYRYFHQSLTDHTRTRTVPETTYRSLLGSVPRSGGATHDDWDRAHPYLLRHIADHAAAAGKEHLESLLSDPGFIVRADASGLDTHLRTAASEKGRLLREIYFQTVPLLSFGHHVDTRRGLLALEAAGRHHADLARDITRTSFEAPRLPPAPRWATHRSPEAAPHTAGHLNNVLALATVTTPDGSLLAITGSTDHTAIVRDAVTGAHLHTLTGHTDWVQAVAVCGVGSSILAVTSSRDRTAVVWDAVTGARLHILTGHTGPVRAMSAAALDGSAIVVTGSQDRTAVVWDAVTGARLHTLTGHTDWIREVSTAVAPDGTLLVVTGSQDRTAVVWDAVTGARL
ncbi:hypothetical protein ACFV6F_08245, partial [Kitasatospora phosalacinea]